MKRLPPILVLCLLGVVCFSLATLLQPRAAAWSRGAQSGSILKVLLGDGRRLFANHFAQQADVSFHSGFYPSIFDNREKPKTTAMNPGDAAHNQTEHEREMDFLGKPRDWIQAFGRHFRITEHTHLESGGEREVLPWLRLSAELDPQRIQTYTDGAFVLCKRLGKVAEAEQFLREGLRNNPDSVEILYELGLLCSEQKHDPERARNLWELALARWTSQEAGKKEPDLFMLEKIAVHLGVLEENAGNYPRALSLLELAKKAARNPAGLQGRIDELRGKLPPASKPN